MLNRELDQKAAIMIVIEHLGGIPAGTRCSAVFCDAERVRREQDFHAKLYGQTGVDDPDTIQAMVEANVPSEPYWLVSLKLGTPTPGEEPRFYRVDARTQKVLGGPASN